MIELKLFGGLTVQPFNHFDPGDGGGSPLPPPSDPGGGGGGGGDLIEP